MMHGQTEIKCYYNISFHISYTFVQLMSNNNNNNNNNNRQFSLVDASLVHFYLFFLINSGFLRNLVTATFGF